MPNYRLNTFTNANDIDAFFKSLSSTGFVDWFNSNIAGRQNWSGKRIESPTNWNKVWSNATILFNKSNFNLIEFLCICSIIVNETGGTFKPLTEGVGSSSYPGISYAFDSISGLKRSYNTLSDAGNKTALSLFNDSSYKTAHGSKPYGSLLKNTTDSRWSSTIFPTRFSGNIPVETDKSGKPNTFLTEADFMKFRGRGYIQTTGRGAYKPIIQYVLNYNGSDSIINSIKSSWGSYNGNLDSIASSSTNDQWDSLFQKTNSVIANYAVWIHSQSSKYSWIDASQSDSNLQKSIRNVASKIAGSGAKSYINLFYARVMQQLNLIENTQAGPIQAGVTASSYQDTSTQEMSRSERTGQDPNDGSQKNGNGILPGIVNIFPTTIKLDPIKFDAPPEQLGEVAQSLGNFPFVWYNAYQIEFTDISFLQISTSENIPSIRIVFKDTLGKMKDQGFPLDDSKIKVFINPRSEQLKPIFMQFKITKFSINETVFTLGGLLDVNNLYTRSYISFSQMTSFKALQSISKNIGLGFNTNVDDTDDSMTWINTGEKTIEFIGSIVETSYKSDETFLLYYIDYYYNLNYVDLEKELSRDLKQDLGVENIGIEEIAKVQDQERVSRLFLTNDMSRRSTNSYFDSYKIINNSTTVSLKEGYSTKLRFYDELSKDFLIFDVDPITSKGNDKILLKGSPQDESFFKSNTNLVYTGKQDIDNMHKNYHYSYIQNMRNIVELEKIGLEIDMGNPNFTLYKFQKIYLFLSNQASTPSASQINNRLSGEWFIIDIVYNFDGIKFVQKIKLVRRELDLSPEELQSEPSQSSKPEKNSQSTSNDSTNSTDTTNPVVSNGDILSGVTASVPIDSSNFPLTKDIFKLIYKGKVSDKVIESYYLPMQNAMIQYSINTKERIAAFLSQINTETSYLKYVTEISSGNEYEGRLDLGNTSPGDGVKFKGRGLIQMIGKTNYQATGNFLNKDFITDTTIVSAENTTHQQGSDTSDQINNTILSAIRFWLKGSSWGNLNDYADNMNIKNPINLGSLTINQLPNSQDSAKTSSYNTKKNDNISSSITDPNFNNFTLICFGVNGGYGGFQDRINNWNIIRGYFK